MGFPCHRVQFALRRCVSRRQKVQNLISFQITLSAKKDHQAAKTIASKVMFSPFTSKKGKQ